MLFGQKYRKFHERSEWMLQSLDLPDAQGNVLLDTQRLPPTADTHASFLHSSGSQSARAATGVRSARKKLVKAGCERQRPGAATARQLEKRTVSHFDFGRETSDWHWVDKVEDNRRSSHQADKVQPVKRRHFTFPKAKPVQKAEDHPFIQQNVRRLWAAVLPHIE